MSELCRVDPQVAIKENFDHASRGLPDDHPALLLESVPFEPRPL